MKKFDFSRRKFICALAVLCTVIFSCLLFAACDTAGGITVPTPPVESPRINSFAAIDVNPSVEFILDQFGNVLGVSGANSDAQALLYNESGIVGSPFNIALENLFAISKNYGFVSDKTQTAGISLVCLDNSLTLEEIAQTVRASAEKCGLSLTTTEDTDLVLAVELEEKNAASSAYNNVTLSQYRLMKRAADVYDEQDAPATAQEQMTALQNAWADADAKLGEVFARAATEAQFVYETTRTFAKDSLYIAYFAAKSFEADGILSAMKYGSRAFYATSYTALHSIQIYLQHIYDLIREFRLHPYFDKAAALEAYAALEPYTDDDFEQFFSSVAAEDGYVPIANLNTYINAVYRSSSAEQRVGLKSAYKALKTTLLDKPRLELLGIDLQMRINDIIEKTTSVAASSLPPVFADALSKLLDGVLELFIDVSNPETIRSAAQVTLQMAQKAYDNIEFTSEELQEAAQISEDISDIIEEAKEKCSQTIAELKQKTENWIDGLKNPR